MKDANRVSGNSATTCHFYEEIDAILGTRAASAPATLLESAADDTVVVPTEEDLVPDSPQSNLDAEIEEANSSAITTTSSTPTNTPFPTPTTTSNATSTSTATTIATTSAGGQPSSSRSLSRPLRSAKGRLAGAKRGTDTLLVLAEMEERAAERQEKLEEKRRKQEAELEDRRREREMQHEERMHSMFMTVFQQMMGSGWGPAPYPPMHPILPPFQPATTEDNGDNPWPPTTSQ